MKNQLKFLIFIISSILFYVAWGNGGEFFYGKVVSTGMNQFISPLSELENTHIEFDENSKKNILYCDYPDRQNSIAIEYCLPIILLMAWHLSLFFNRRLVKKLVVKLFVINVAIIYSLQIIFPLLLFNISLSKTKSISLFIGLQVFSFIALFLILKDSIIIKTRLKQNSFNQD